MTFSSEVATERSAEWLRTWAGLIAIFAVFAATGLICAHFGIIEAKPHFGEDGTIEIATPVVYVLVALLYIAWRGQIGVQSLVPSFILVLMAWRELDGDQWFTDKSVISTGYYFDNPDVGYGERILVAAILLPLGLITLRFLWNVRYRILTAIRALQPYCRSLIAAFLLLGASLVLDGLGRKVYGYLGVHLPTTVSVLAGIIEEAGELGMAVAFLAALLQLRFDPERNTLPGRAGQSVSGALSGRTFR